MDIPIADLIQITATFRTGEACTTHAVKVGPRNLLDAVELFNFTVETNECPLFRPAGAPSGYTYALTISGVQVEPNAIRTLADARRVIEEVRAGTYELVTPSDRPLPYRGLAYFWHEDFRHYLRDASHQQRKVIRNRFEKMGLPVDGATDAHRKVVELVAGEVRQ